MTSDNPIFSPVHYELWGDTQVIDIIRTVLTKEEFIGYCKGNFLKYRLRAGKKGDPLTDLGKSDVYLEWLRAFEKRP